MNIFVSCKSSNVYPLMQGFCFINNFLLYMMRLSSEFIIIKFLIVILSKKKKKKNPHRYGNEIKSGIRI